MQAVRYFNKGLVIYPDNKEAWSALGEALIYLGRYEEAYDALTKYLEMAPGSSKAYNNLNYIAKQYADNQKYSRALSVYRFLSKQHGISADYTIQMAEVYCQYNRIGEFCHLQPDYITFIIKRTTRQKHDV